MVADEDGGGGGGRGVDSLGEELAVGRLGGHHPEIGGSGVDGEVEGLRGGADLDGGEVFEVVSLGVSGYTAGLVAAWGGDMLVS